MSEFQATVVVILALLAGYLFGRADEIRYQTRRANRWPFVNR